MSNEIPRDRWPKEWEKVASLYPNHLKKTKMTNEERAAEKYPYPEMGLSNITVFIQRKQDADRERAAYIAGREEAGEWVSVDDGLPEIGEPVSTKSSIGRQVGWFNGATWDGTNMRLNRVTHWQPLL
jgi:hypothetical protein